MSSRSMIRAAAAASLAAALAGCRDMQSALAPLGEEAGAVNTLFWIMTWASLAIFLLVLLATVLAIYGGPSARGWLARERLIFRGGLVFPIVVLTLLLGGGLYLMRIGPASGLQEDASITVIGERWWWRVIYTDANGRTFESANELRIPSGTPVRIALKTADVIHSFWAPRLAGKLDMIPGRTNVITINAKQPGISRGQCAEYCGGAHAMMSFYVVAMAPDDYRNWLDQAAAPAPEPQDEVAVAGRKLFFSSGCEACHTIRGTPASGTIGPDLTHVGARRSLGAGVLPNNAAAFARWITENQHIKPENLMPAFEIFTKQELAALSRYLEGLR